MIVSEQLSDIQTSLTNRHADSTQQALSSLESIERNRTEALDDLFATLKELTKAHQLTLDGVNVYGQMKKLETQISKIEKRSQNLIKNSHILQSLCYPTMVERRSNISTAHTATFKWILNPAPDDRDPRIFPRFHNWLQSDKSIY